MASKRGDDWGTSQQLISSPKFRLVLRSYGAEKAGKNHFGLTAPGPIAVHCLDVLGLEGTAEKFVKAGKEIHAFKYRFNKRTSTQDDAKAVQETFLEDLEISKRNARTVQVDETEMWEVFRYARFNDKSGKPNNYDELNADYREWIHSFETTDVNLQLIQKVKEKWETVEEVDKNGRKVQKGRPSGRMEPTGFKEAGYIVQANLEHRWEKERSFVVKVVNCRQNMELAGEEFEGLDFPTLAQLVFPESSDGDWQ